MKSVVTEPFKIADFFSPHVLIPNDPILPTEVNVVLTSAEPEVTWAQQLEWLKTHDLCNAS